MVTSKGIKLRAIAAKLEREAAELRRMADLADGVARVVKKAKKSKVKKAPRRKAAKKVARKAKKSTAATVRAAKKAVGRSR